MRALLETKLLTPSNKEMQIFTKCYKRSFSANFIGCTRSLWGKYIFFFND